MVFSQSCSVLDVFICSSVVSVQVGRGPQQQRELGLPKIRDVIYVGCPAAGKDEGVADLRKALYDIAFTLTLPKGWKPPCVY